jgi:uncharacterized RmlC-like cupin family protein
MGMPRPLIYRVLKREANGIRKTRFGAVGNLFRGDGIEVVWVSKQNEAVDPNWFSQEKVDLIAVVQGKLRVDYARRLKSRILGPGDLLVLPPKTRCRAYRWPRSAKKATVFLAIYPS